MAHTRTQTTLWIFVTYDEKSCLKKGCLIIDVSCDEGMGFLFLLSRQHLSIQCSQLTGWTTTQWITRPAIYGRVLQGPISAALIVHLPTILEGHKAWNKNATVHHAINVDQGVVQKNEILQFQNRNLEYPHSIR